MTAAPIMLAAGGTGGHLFPAEALAAALKARGRSVVLVTDRRSADYGGRFPDVAVHVVRSATPTGAGALGRALALAQVAAGTLAARRFLRQLRPAAALGFGGYPSLPGMFAAIRLGLPTAVHEQNAVLGRANRLLTPRVGKIATAFPEIQRLRPTDCNKLVLIGNPVRPAFRAIRERVYVPPAPTADIRILVLGGSQGARILSEVIPEALVALPAVLRGRLRVSQQCRPEDLPRVRDLYGEGTVAAELAPFFSDVAERLDAAHLCIARAGASTCAELTVAGRPALLIPYARATDGHQEANAAVLTAAGAARMILEPAFTPDILQRILIDLFAAPDELTRMAERARGLGLPTAAENLADMIEGLAENGGDHRRIAA
jgi:UDP-N-acetylglucosamine--N-acetylmuramyl-(pentapeptide) pyrophosphoryl-undecaprenol N-acetylglucosamine transferase